MLNLIKNSTIIDFSLIFNFNNIILDNIPYSYSILGF